jgi:hypothetical protein
MGMRLLAIFLGLMGNQDIEIGTKAGQMHPDFILPNIEGGFTRLSDFRGKKILLFHFASW